jgi:hypothetical protein
MNKTRPNTPNRTRSSAAPRGWHFEGYVVVFSVGVKVDGVAANYLYILICVELRFFV